MKKYYCILIALVALVAGAKDYEPLPAEYDGSMMPYDFAKVDTAFAVPDSLEITYVWYAARHGARFLSSENKISGMEKKLAEAPLSTDGKAFVALMHEIDSLTAGRWGQLSPVGIEEERRLAKDMARLAPDLLKQGQVRSYTTFVPRVIMTAYEFNHALELDHQELDIFAKSGHIYDWLLYFFDYSPKYKEYRESGVRQGVYDEYKEYRESGAWQGIYDEFVAEHVSPEPARRLFASGHKASDEHLRSLTMDMYAILQGCRAAGFAPPTTQWMSVDEYRGCWLASNLKHYLRNTPNELNPACLPAVASLVRMIFQDLYYHELFDGIDDKAEVFSGYFGHAETLLPFFAALRLPGCWAENYDDLASHWRLQEITPLAANMALLITRPKGPRPKGQYKGRRYAIVLLNGRPVEPIPGLDQVVPWESLKAYWKSLID